jgi:hypothetical protein
MFKTQISRKLAAEYGRQAVQITESREYLAPSGRVDAEMARPPSPSHSYDESSNKVGHHESA